MVTPTTPTVTLGGRTLDLARLSLTDRALGVVSFQVQGILDAAVGDRVTVGQQDYAVSKMTVQVTPDGGLTDVLARVRRDDAALLPTLYAALPQIDGLAVSDTLLADLAGKVGGGAAYRAIVEQDMGGSADLDAALRGLRQNLLDPVVSGGGVRLHPMWAPDGNAAAVTLSGEPSVTITGSHTQHVAPGVITESNRQAAVIAADTVLTAMREMMTQPLTALQEAYQLFDDFDPLGSALARIPANFESPSVQAENAMARIVHLVNQAAVGIAAFWDTGERRDLWRQLLGLLRQYEPILGVSLIPPAFIPMQDPDRMRLFLLQAWELRDYRRAGTHLVTPASAAAVSGQLRGQINALTAAVTALDFAKRQLAAPSAPSAPLRVVAHYVQNGQDKTFPAGRIAADSVVLPGLHPSLAVAVLRVEQEIIRQRLAAVQAQMTVEGAVIRRRQSVQAALGVRGISSWLVTDSRVDWESGLPPTSRVTAIAQPETASPTADVREYGTVQIAPARVTAEKTGQQLLEQQPIGTVFTNDTLVRAIHIDGAGRIYAALRGRPTIARLATESSLDAPTADYIYVYEVGEDRPVSVAVNTARAAAVKAAVNAQWSLATMPSFNPQETEYRFHEAGGVITLATWNSGGTLRTRGQGLQRYATQTDIVAAGICRVGGDGSMGTWSVVAPTLLETAPYQWPIAGLALVADRGILPRSDMSGRCWVSSRNPAVSPLAYMRAASAVSPATVAMTALGVGSVPTPIRVGPELVQGGNSMPLCRRADGMVYGLAADGRLWVRRGDFPAFELLAETGIYYAGCMVDDGEGLTVVDGEGNRIWHVRFHGRTATALVRSF